MNVGRLHMTIRYAVTFFALAFCSVFLGRADLARANDDMPLDQVGGVCVPDSATIRAGGYETRGFGVGFSGASTGSIRLLCPITVTANMLGAKIGLIFMSVIDGDGMNTGSAGSRFSSPRRDRNERRDHRRDLRFEHLEHDRAAKHGLFLSPRDDPDQRVLLVGRSDRAHRSKGECRIPRRWTARRRELRR